MEYYPCLFCHLAFMSQEDYCQHRYWYHDRFILGENV